MYKLYSVIKHSTGTIEVSHGSFTWLKELLFSAYYIGDTDPEALFRIDPFDIYFRPFGVSLKVMYDDLDRRFTSAMYHSIKKTS